MVSKTITSPVVCGEATLSRATGLLEETERNKTTRLVAQLTPAHLEAGDATAKASREPQAGVNTGLEPTEQVEWTLHASLSLRTVMIDPSVSNVFGAPVFEATVRTFS